MAITYTYNDETNTSIKKVDDSTTPDTVSFIPVAVGNRHYDALVAAGTSIAAHTPVYVGYENITNARATRTREAETALHDFLESSGLLFKIRRAEYDSTYSLASADATTIQDAYDRYAAFVTDLGNSNIVHNVRTSVIDYSADTHNVPAQQHLNSNKDVN